MPIYKKADAAVYQLASELIAKYETHQPLGHLAVRIDFVFAYADQDEKGRILNDALTKNGLKTLGITRKIGLKDRVLGRGDAEVALDGDYWGQASAEEQAALLDHELHHISVKTDKMCNPQFDDLGRPLIRLRKHDVEVGWFKCIAERHGLASQEQQQAKRIMDSQGQYYWPGIAPTLTVTTGGETTGPLPMDSLTKANALIARKGGRK